MATNPLSLSDEDFLKQPLPETGEVSSVTPQAEETPAPAAEPTPEPEAQEPEVEEQNNAEGEADAGKTGDEAAEPEGSGAEAGKEAESKPEGEANTPAPGSEAKPTDAGKPADGDAGQKDSPPNYQAFYDQVMKPFTANGKEIALKTPEEAIQLMQMGANYTRKMQELAPHRKLLTMLTNNKLDEDKLSFLIDLDKKDPEAIKRLIKDSGLDPLDIDTNTEPAYRAGSHKVSDNEVAFHTQLEELGSNPQGKETLQTIDSTWDQSSKELLWQHPEVLSVIHAQREAGIYAKIVTEVDRQKTLGQLKADMPFLDAYRQVGDAMHEAGAFTAKTESEAGKTADTPKPQVDPKPEPVPVATRTAAPKPDDAAARAAAAASPRTTPAKAKEAVNFLSMSDEEFAKLDGFAGRV